MRKKGKEEDGDLGGEDVDEGVGRERNGRVFLRMGDERRRKRRGP